MSLIFIVHLRNRQQTTKQQHYLKANLRLRAKEYVKLWGCVVLVGKYCTVYTYPSGVL